MNSNTLPFREPYVFPPKPEVLNTPKIYVKQLFIGLGIQFFVFSWVFICLVYTKEARWFCHVVATLTSLLASNFYWMKNEFRETTSESDNSTDNKCFNSGYKQHGYVSIKQ